MKRHAEVTQHLLKRSYNSTDPEFPQGDGTIQRTRKRIQSDGIEFRITSVIPTKRGTSAEESIKIEPSCRT